MDRASLLAAIHRERQLRRAGIITAEDRRRPYPGQRYKHGWIPVGAAFDALSLSLLGDDELADLFHKVTVADTIDEDALRRVDLEFARRDDRHREMMAALDANDGAFDQALDDLSVVEDDTPAHRRIDDLVARGHSYRDAYAEVHNLDADELTKSDLGAIVDAQKVDGETRERVVRRLYEEYVHLSMLRAEDWTRGHMLSSAGKSAGISALSLFSGQRSRARKYASEELKRFWDEVEPRQTYTEFRAMMLGRESDKKAAKKIKQQGQEKDFGL